MAATVNLLNGQQADIESADMSQFRQGLGASGGVSRDTSTSVFDSGSLKCVADGSGTFQSVSASAPIANFSPNEVITLSGYVKAKAGQSPTLRFYCQANDFITGNTSVGTVTTIHPTSTGWTRYSVTVTLPNPLAFGGTNWSYLGLRVDTGGSAQAVTWWMDCLMITAGGVLLPWVPGSGSTTGIALPYMAYIGGQPVELVAGSMNATAQVGQRATGSIGAWSPLGVTWQYGTQFQLYDNNSNLVYAGYTTKDKATRGAGAVQGVGYLDHSVDLMDNAYKADKRVIFAQYLQQSAGSIAQDLVNKVLSQEGVTFTAHSIAAGATIPEVIWNGKRISEALTWLATQCGFWWQIDLNGVLWFQPYGGIPAPLTLDGTQVDSTQNLAVVSGNDMYVNSQYTKGAYAEKGSKTAQLHETFVGDGKRRNFTLSYPVSTLYELLVDGVDVTTSALSKGQTGGQWYYARGDAVLAQDTGQPVLTSSDTLDVFYSGRYPVIGVAKNPALITAQKAREGATGSGIVESVYVNTKVHTLPAAFQIASALLSHFGQDATLLDFDTRAVGLMPGQMLTVTLSDFNLINKQMLIISVAISDQNDQYNIWYHVQAVGSPYEAAQFTTFWQSLMNQSADPSDLSDTTDTALAQLLDSVFTHTPFWNPVTITKATCPIIADTLLCGNTVIIC